MGSSEFSLCWNFHVMTSPYYPLAYSVSDFIVTHTLACLVYMSCSPVRWFECFSVPYDLCQHRLVWPIRPSWSRCLFSLRSFIRSVGSDDGITIVGTYFILVSHLQIISNLETFYALQRLPVQVVFLLTVSTLKIRKLCRIWKIMPLHTVNATFLTSNYLR